jgi:hypothetical protein
MSSLTAKWSPTFRISEIVFINELQEGVFWDLEHKASLFYFAV